MKVQSSKLEIASDSAARQIVVSSIDNHDIINPLLVIDHAVLQKMSSKEASEFLGERIIYLLSDLHEMFKR